MLLNAISRVAALREHVTTEDWQAVRTVENCNEKCFLVKPPHGDYYVGFEEVDVNRLNLTVGRQYPVSTSPCGKQGPTANDTLTSIKITGPI